MHQFASVPGASLGLIGEEPPLSPETVGRAPGSSAFLDGPVTVKPIPAFPRAAPTPERQDQPTGGRRVVLRLLGGDEIELGSFDDREEAMEAAAEIVALLAAAEASSDWPEIEGRFLRPGSIASIDVLAAE